MKHMPSRREFVKQSLMGATLTGAALGHAGGAAGAAEHGIVPRAPLFSPEDTMLPHGKIGDIAVSRILLGGNLLTHFTHSRDLKYVYRLCAHYNTEQKIMETMALAENQGINTLVIHTAPGVLDLLKRYREELGGAMQWIICPTTQVDQDPRGYEAQIKELAAIGTEAVYLWGVTADRLVEGGDIDAIARAVAIGREHGLPSGVGAHDLRVVQACEEHDIPADFYIQTFHHHNYPSAPRPEELTAVYREVPGYWCRAPQQVIDVMQDVEKPWIAFKIMAAGAIPPENALRHAFNNGADFALMGMFDFEIEENVLTACQVLADLNRTRPWRG